MTREKIAGLSLRIFRHLYCGRVVQKSHSSTPKFTRPHLEHTKYANTSEAIENLWNILFQKFDMFLWTSGFQNPLVHTDFDMFVDE